METENELIQGIAALSAEMGEDPEAAVDGPVEYPVNENLVSRLPADVVKAIGMRVVENAKRDETSGEGWRKQAALFLELYDNTSRDAAIEDQPNIAPLTFPFFTRAVQIFKSKLFSHLFPDDRQLVGVAASGPETNQEDADRRQRVALHMNTQLENEITDYRKTCDRNMDRFLIEGCVFEVWYYDPVTKKPAHRFVRADDMIVPYKHEFLRWDMGDFPRLSWVKRYYRHELEAEEEAGYYVNVTTGPDAIYKGSEYDIDGAAPREQAPMSSKEHPSTDVDDRLTGQAAPTDGDDQRQVLEQDCYVRLPGSKKQRFCTVCVDRSTSTVLRIALCEQPDLSDMSRADSDAAQWEMDAAAAAAVGLPLPPPPAPPAMKPWHRWVQYCCFENPGGAYGHGIGHRVANFNITANKLGTRAMALMTMSLIPTGFFSKQARPTGSSNEMTMTLGKMTESSLTPDQVSAGAGFKLFQFPPPDPNWFRVIQQLDEACQELTAYNIAAGGQGLSGDTATTTEIRNSNATDTISTVAIRYNAPRAQSMRNLAYLNSQTLPEEGVMVGGKLVTREDYTALLSDMRIVWSCDPRVDSQSTRERRAMKILQTVTQILSTPVGQDTPLLDPATATTLLRAVAVNALKELGVSQELYQTIIDAPLPNMGGPEEMPPEGEGMGTPAATDEPLPGDDVNGQPSQVGMDQSLGDRPVQGPLA